jgi:hypothetical protein
MHLPPGHWGDSTDKQMVSTLEDSIISEAMVMDLVSLDSRTGEIDGGSRRHRLMGPWALWKPKLLGILLLMIKE